MELFKNGVPPIPTEPIPAEPAGQGFWIFVDEEVPEHDTLSERAAAMRFFSRVLLLPEFSFLWWIRCLAIFFVDLANKYVFVQSDPTPARLQTSSLSHCLKTTPGRTA